MKRLLSMLLAGIAFTAGAQSGAFAHDFRVGDLRVEHPYALPTAPGARTGAVYLRLIRNPGKSADRLVSATTPIAARVELHNSSIDATGVMRMREIDAIEVPASTDVSIRHGGGLHLMLIDLQAPLKNGDRFPLTLRFERSGAVEVKVWVQQPRGLSSDTHRH